jgi:hypothetical protein
MGSLDGSGAGGPVTGGRSGAGVGEAGVGEAVVGGTGVADVDDFALDGNAIGGMMMEVFGSDMTTAVGTCASCGAVAQVAEFAVYMPGLGIVVRCRSCNAVLMVFVRIHEITCVDLEGLASLS